MGSRFLSAALASGVGCLVSACLLHPVDTEPAPGVELPLHFSMSDPSSASGDGGPPAPVVDFDPGRDAFAADAALGELVATGVAGSLTVAQATARLAQARTGVATAAAGLLPTIAVTGSATETFIDDAPDPDRTESLTGVGTLSLDLFGEDVAAILAARQDATAAALNVANARLQISHEIAGAYYNAAEARASLALIDFQIELTRELQELTELRFGQGAGSLSDILQQEEQTASLEAQRPPLVSNLRVAENRLDALLGRAPDGVDRTTLAELTYPDAALALGAPAALLDSRPDLLAARAALVAADYRVAEAVADFFPDVNLSGMLSIPNLAMASTMIWTAAASATQTLLNGGRRIATVRRQGAVVEERTAAYAQAWIDAIAEVENLAWQERNQRDLIARLERQVEVGTAALEASRRRYLQGTVSYVTVLSSLQSVQATERSLVQARRRLIDLRLDLLRALGLTPTGEMVLEEGYAAQPSGIGDGDEG